jgi:hypothetical protein
MDRPAARALSSPRRLRDWRHPRFALERLAFKVGCAVLLAVLAEWTAVGGRSLAAQVPSWLALATGLVLGAAVVPVLWAISEWAERFGRLGASRASRLLGVVVCCALLLAARPLVWGLAALAGHGHMERMVEAIPGVIAGFFSAFVAMGAAFSGDLRRARRLRARDRLRT